MILQAKCPSFSLLPTKKDWPIAKFQNYVSCKNNHISSYINYIRKDCNLDILCFVYLIFGPWQVPKNIRIMVKWLVYTHKALYKQKIIYSEILNVPHPNLWILGIEEERYAKVVIICYNDV